MSATSSKCCELSSVLDVAAIWCRVVTWRHGHVVGGSLVLKCGTAVELSVLILSGVAGGVVGNRHVLKRRWALGTTIVTVAMAGGSKGNTGTNALRTVAASQSNLGAVFVATKRDQVLAVGGAQSV